MKLPFKVLVSIWLMCVIIIITSLTMRPAVPHGDVKAVVFDDLGGFIRDYEQFVTAADRDDTLVEVYGRCASGCVRKISARRFCMGPYATFATHEVRSTYAASSYEYDKGKRDEAATQEFRAALPACARALFDARDGFASGTTVTVSGAELRAACPQLRLCDGELTYWRHVENLWQTHAEGFRKYGMEVLR